MADTYKAPSGAASEAKRALKWKEEHGSAVKGGTAVGWARARQLANGEALSKETVKRMYKFFQRHEKNRAIKPEFKGEPWRDNGYVAWLIWGGDAGKSWAEKMWSRFEREEKQAADGLWDNIRKKRKRGEPPAQPGDEDYPDAETWDELTASSALLVRLAREVLADKYLQNPSSLFSKVDGKSMIFFDTETTGLSPADSQVTEIAAVATNGSNFNIEKVFRRKIKLTPDTLLKIQEQVDNPPRGKSVEDLLEMTGYDTIDLEQTDEMVALREFRDFCASNMGILVAHNAEFDMKMVATKIGPIPNQGVLDTLKFSRLFFIPALKVLADGGDAQAQETLDMLKSRSGKYSSRLKQVADALGLRTGNWHEGLEDVKSTIKVFGGIKDFFSERREVEDNPEFQKERGLARIYERGRKNLKRQLRAWKTLIRELGDGESGYVQFGYAKPTGASRNVRLIPIDMFKKRFGEEWYVKGLDVDADKEKMFVIQRMTSFPKVKNASANPYLNTPPTKLRRDIENESDPDRKKQMVQALNAWRLTQPGPFRKSGGDS